MTNVEKLTQRFETVFDRRQSSVLAETITEAYSDLVKTGDFSELKAIVKDLAESQKRTEARMDELAQAQKRTEASMGELAKAQQRTEASMSELAEEQRRTDAKMGELAEAQQRMVEAQQRTEGKLSELTETQNRTDVQLSELAQAQNRTETSISALTRAITGMTQELGGLSRSMSYSLENESYRNLPALLKSRYAITINEKIVRLDFDGEEINLFARGERDGQPVYLVGESKLQLDERRNNRRAAAAIFDQIDKKAAVVQRRYPDAEIVRVLLTHYARAAVLEQAKARGVLVIQSFEW